MSKMGESGMVHILLLAAAVGLVVFLVISSSASFKDNLFATLYPKPISQAASRPTPEPTVSPKPTSSPTPSPTPSVVPTKMVFVTSSTYSGNLGGLSGADSKCQSKANAAGLKGTWKAWLSDDTTSASSRLTHFNGPYVRKDGLVVATSWRDLTDGTLQNPIRIDELGGDMYNYTTAAWTGTSTSGNIIKPNCNNWTNNSSSYDIQGVYGGISSTKSYWTVSAESTSICSNNNVALYCFEQ